MNLNQYGSGCRCLLRIRENLGNPHLLEESFIAHGRHSYPDWAERPGAADLPRLCEIAGELGISSGGEVFCDYARILGLHRIGHSVLIRARRPSAAGAERIALVVDMDERGMNLWIPTPDGSYDTAWESREEFAAGALTAGIVLYREQPGRNVAAIALASFAQPSADAAVPAAGTELWSDWSAALIDEARRSIEDMSARRWLVAHPEDPRMPELIAQIDAGPMANRAVETPRMIRWRSALDGRTYILVEFFSLRRQTDDSPPEPAAFTALR
ncbi:MAG TPA: hypothetical protein VFE31_08610 [Opitutaceae bacterium]|nr:hypothetical protein [Opitutaceae bacterium]